MAEMNFVRVCVICAGVMDAKKAVETDGDIEKAIELLREYGEGG